MRLVPRAAFLELPKRLVVNFYTTSIDKYVQADYMFSCVGLALQHFRSRVDPYRESYGRGKEILLIEAINEIRAEIGRKALFFVEDTSLRIEALSTSLQDYPGLEVKEWFARTDFTALNKMLPLDKSGRRAVVRSDIALHVPGLGDPLFFRGETPGTIAYSAPDFEENRYHPWLTPSNFNGWIVPDGATRRLGEMSIDESLKYDFRARSLLSLIERLEEFAAVLNVPHDCYLSMPPVRPESTQKGLFDSDQPSRTLVVVGATCAGKTTFGQIASGRNRNYKLIEASNIVRSFLRREDEGLSALEFAIRLLDRHGPAIVAEKAITMYRLEGPGDVVITGLRTIEELDAVLRVRPEAEIVLLEASGRTRFSRYRERGRDPVLSYREFARADKEQWRFGLLRVAQDFSDFRISNEGTLSDYEQQVYAVLSRSEHMPGVSVNTRPPYLLGVHRLFRCLSILEEQARSMTCDEIEAITSSREADSVEGGIVRYSGKKITHNNVNKILKEVPELAKRIESSEERVRYELTNAGRSYLRLMTKYAEGREVNGR